MSFWSGPPKAPQLETHFFEVLREVWGGDVFELLRPENYISRFCPRPLGSPPLFGLGPDGLLLPPLSLLLLLALLPQVGVKDRIIAEDRSVARPKDYFREQGNAAVKELFGYKQVRLQQRLRLLHPAYGQWVTDFGFGRVRSRPGPSQKVRALCELAALGGQFVPPQFRVAIIMTLTAGATLEEVRAVLDTVTDIWGSEQQAAIDSFWSDLTLRRVAERGWDFEKADEDLLRNNEVPVRGPVACHVCMDLRPPHPISA